MESACTGNAVLVVVDNDDDDDDNDDDDYYNLASAACTPRGLYVLLALISF